MSDGVLLTRDGAIATITLNKPERMNALDRGMWERIGAIMGELGADDSLRCIVLRGATMEGKPRAFAAGADIAEFKTERADRNRRPATATRCITRCRRCAPVHTRPWR